MSTITWLGGRAAAVAQVWTASIDSLDGTPANDTFTVTIGGITVSVAGTTDVATTATALRAALNASTHPYFAAVTWSGSSGNIIGTADTAGVAFAAALTHSGAGSGTVTDFAVTTANGGPYSAASDPNYDGGAVPTTGDTLIFPRGCGDCLWDLDAITDGLAAVRVDVGAGAIGLPGHLFTTSASGDTTNATALEYRPHELEVDADRITVGYSPDGATNWASTRCNLRQLATDDTVMEVLTTPSSAQDGTGYQAVHLRAGSANADVIVCSGQAGGIGICTARPGETGTLGNITVAGSAAKVFVGEGCSWTNYYHSGGANILRAANSPTLVEARGSGQLTLDGNFALSTLSVYASATVVDNNRGTVTALNLKGGTLDWQQSDESRTRTTVTYDGGSLKDNQAVSIGTFNRPRRASISAA